MEVPRFDLPDDLLEQLRSLPAEEATDGFLANERAFLLDPGLGPTMYLTSEGRVLRDGRYWDGEPVREAGADEAIAALVTGAQKTGIAALLDLIPGPPANSKKRALNAKGIGVYRSAT